jgi:outer membrane protein TolC
MSRRVRVFLLLLSGAFAGCARYSSEPLTQARVDAALTLSPDDVQQLAAQHQPSNGLTRDVVVDLRDGLSPDEAAVVAVAINPALRAQRDRIASGSAQLLQAGILPNPQLTMDVEPVIGGNTVGTSTGYAAGLNWEVTALITRDAKRAAARSSADSVSLGVAWNEWQTAQAARLAVFDLVSLQHQLNEAREVSRRLDENASTVKKAVDQGLRTVVDLSAAEAANQEARTTVLEQERELAHQRVALARALGTPAGFDLQVAPELKLPSRLELPEAADFLDGLESRRLDLLALKRGYDAQESTLRAAVLAQFPKIALGFTPTRDTSNVHSIILGATIDLPLFDRNQGVIATEKATRQQLYDEYVQRVFEARSDVITALQDIRSINNQIEAAEAALPSLERLADVYRKALDAGNADVLSYYGSRNELARKRIEVEKLKQQLVQNAVALELASGRYLPGLSATATTQATARAGRGAP